MTHGYGMTGEHVANATREFDSERNIKELHQALLSTQGVAEFLHEMAILAARLVGVSLSCGMIMRLAENFAEDASGAL